MEENILQDNNEQQKLKKKVLLEELCLAPSLGRQQDRTVETSQGDFFADIVDSLHAQLTTFVAIFLGEIFFAFELHLHHSGWLTSVGATSTHVHSNRSCVDFNLLCTAVDWSNVLDGPQVD